MPEMNEQKLLLTLTSFLFKIHGFNVTITYMFCWGISMDTNTLDLIAEMQIDYATRMRELKIGYFNFTRIFLTECLYFDF